MKRKVRKIWHVFAFVAIFAVAIAVIMLLWNALIPTIIGWSAINYWQAAGLAILCKLLFGGFGRFHPMGHQWSHRERKDFHEKLRDMPRDERREFIRRKMMAGFRDFHGDNESSNQEPRD